MRITEKEPEKIFLLLGTIFISLMIFVMPLNRVPDEITHAHFGWQTIYDQDTAQFDWRKTIGHDSNINMNDYKKLFTEKVDFSQEKYKFTFKVERLQHIPSLFGLWLGKLIYPSLGVMMTLGRIFNAIFYIISLYFIIKYMKFGKHALTFIALLPILVQQAASLSYDVPNFIAVAFFFAVVSDLVVNHVLTSRRLTLLLLAFLSLFLTKKNNIFLVLILPFIDIEFPATADFLNKRKKQLLQFVHKSRWILFPFATIVILGLATFYFSNKGGITHFTQVMLNTIFNTNLNGQLNSILTVGMFGYIGWFQMQFPLWVIFIDISVLTIFLIASNDSGQEIETERFYPVISALMLPLQILIIVGGMYFAWTPLVLGENATISLGGQGRYFTPFLIYLSPLFMSINRNLQVQTNRRFLNRIMIGTILFNLLFMLYLIAMLYWFPDNQANWLTNLRALFN